MATNGEAFGYFSGRPRFRLRLGVARYAVDVANNRSRYNWTLRAYNLDGVSYTWDGGSYGWSVNVEGSTWSGNWTPDFRGGQSYIQLGSGVSGWKSHNGNGDLRVNYFANARAAGIFGSAGASGNFLSNRIPATPGPPSYSMVSTTPTSITYRLSSPSDTGHAALTRAQHQLSQSGAGWGDPIQSKIYPYPAGQSTFDFTGLNPNIRYAIRVRYENGDGWGDWGPTVYGTTLPGSPPTLNSVTPGASGRTAVITGSPPSGLPNVDEYAWERRNYPGGQWGSDRARNTAPTYTSTTLTPGQTYEWRMQVRIGEWWSDYSNTIVATQPQPNASPGQFFDGDTPDSTDTTFDWVGTAGASRSTARSRGRAIGWLKGEDVTAVSGGSAVQAQVTDSLVGTARDKATSYTILTDATDNGVRMGTDGSSDGSEVSEGGVYMGSIYVKSAQARPLAAQWIWYDSSGGEVGVSPLGETRDLIADTPVRLSVLATAPMGAARGGVVATDPPGTDLFLTGDSVVVDAAMSSVGVLYPYFDGATPDTSLYRYEWEGAADESPSLRTDVPQAEQNPLQDPDCDPIPAPPRPPVVEDDCVTPVGTWRRYWVVVSSGDVSRWLDTVPTVYLETHSDAERQVRIRYYSNPEGLDPLEFDASDWEAEQIVSYIPPQTVITIDGVSERVWASVDGAAEIAADSLLYGTGGVPATWPTLNCGTPYLISLDTPLTADVGNLTANIALTVRS